jgi:hypothetical protein
MTPLRVRHRICGGLLLGRGQHVTSDVAPAAEAPASAVHIDSRCRHQFSRYATPKLLLQESEPPVAVARRVTGAELVRQREWIFFRRRHSDGGASQQNNAPTVYARSLSISVQLPGHVLPKFRAMGFF